MLSEIIKDARSRIVVLGVSPLAAELDAAAPVLANLLVLNPQLTLTVIYESDFECFHQSLLLDSADSKTRRSYANLTTHRDRISGPNAKRLAEDDGPGLKRSVLAKLDEKRARAEVSPRIQLRQQNLRMPFHAILVDDRVLFAFVTDYLPESRDYKVVEPSDAMYEQVLDYIHSCLDSSRAGRFLSRPGDELIELYDPQGYPRGVFPRSCFYTSAYKRYSIWGFVFNRRGKLLLHQRSQTTKDGRGLWDKSVGGHKDQTDYSTVRTAQRELIEELYVPEAENAKFVRAYLRDVNHFGSWNPAKRSEWSMRDAFKDLDERDWIFFQATEADGDVLTVDRKSSRRLHDDDGTIRFADSWFLSDVFLYIAPEGSMDTDSQLADTFEIATKRGAAQDHKLVTIEELRDWIAEMQSNGSAADTFTSDLMHVSVEYAGLLERFSEFVKYTFESD